MSRSPRRLLATAFLAVTISAIPSLALGNHSWNGYHWARQQNPFTLKTGDNVGSAWDSYLNTTISDWTQSTVLNLTKVIGAAKGRNCRPGTGRVEVCNAAYGNNGWLGIAQIWVTGGVHITQGSVRVNDTYFNTSTYNSSAWRNLVMCQEVGHTLGLDHQDTNFDNANLGTCMDYTSDPSTNQHPNKHDYDELVTIYTHLDDFTTVGAGAVTSGFGNAIGWGQLVSSSAGGRSSDYRLDLGNGQMVLTHVIWAR
jgi:hypothetical protein